MTWAAIRKEPGKGNDRAQFFVSCLGQTHRASWLSGVPRTAPAAPSLLFPRGTAAGIASGRTPDVSNIPAIARSGRDEVALPIPAPAVIEEGEPVRISLVGATEHHEVVLVIETPPP